MWSVVVPLLHQLFLLWHAQRNTPSKLGFTSPSFKARRLRGLGARRCSFDDSLGSRRFSQTANNNHSLYGKENLAQASLLKRRWKVAPKYSGQSFICRFRTNPRLTSWEVKILYSLQELQAFAADRLRSTKFQTTPPSKERKESENAITETPARMTLARQRS